MSRDVMQQALDAIGSAYREHFVHTHGSTKNELQDAANALRAAMRNAMKRPCPAAEQLHFLLDRDITYADGDATLRFATNDQAMAAVRLGREIAARAAA